AMGCSGDDWKSDYVIPAAILYSSTGETGAYAQYGKACGMEAIRRATPSTYADAASLAAYKHLSCKVITGADFAGCGSDDLRSKYADATRNFVVDSLVLDSTNPGPGEDPTAFAKVKGELKEELLAAARMHEFMNALRSMVTPATNGFASDFQLAYELLSLEE